MRRRDFLRRAAATGIGLPLVIPSRALATPDRPGANDRISVGFVGLGGRARWILTNETLAGAQVTAVADCFLPRCHQATRLHPDGARWRMYQDYRQMLDQEKLDALLVETTTHARVLICIHALQAGLDVYAEKPLTLTIREGRVLADTAAQYGRILQTGTQQRSMPCNMYASQLIRGGAIGKIHTVRVCNFKGPLCWTPPSAQPVPDGLDWDQWCNQTALLPYHGKLQFDWAPLRIFDGGGQTWGVTGWGSHALDQVQCALGTDNTGPTEVWPEQTGPGAKVTMGYTNGTLVKLEGPCRGHEDLGAIFIGQEGRIEIQRGRFSADPKELLKHAPDPTPEGQGESTAHIQNFFDCMRTRERPNADAEIGHRSTTICHLVNICRQLGRKIEWDPQTERFLDDDEANQMLARPRRKGYQLPGEGAQLTAESRDSKTETAPRTVESPEPQVEIADRQAWRRKRRGQRLPLVRRILSALGG
jgi:predicted dehydrogenase